MGSKNEMFRSHTTYGSLKVTKEVNSLYDSLTDLNHLQKWLSKHVSMIDHHEILVPKLFSFDSKIWKLSITQEKKSHTIWTCHFNEFEIIVIFTISPCSLSIELKCNEFSINTFIQEWTYMFYRLKDYVENGKSIIPSFDYSIFDPKSLSITLNINTSSSVVFSRLTQNHYLSQIFSKYPICDLDSFHRRGLARGYFDGIFFDA